MNPATATPATAPRLAPARAKNRERQSPALTSYLGAIGRHRLLSPEEEVAAAQRLFELKAAYWAALLAMPEIVEALAELAAGELGPGSWSELLAALLQQRAAGRDDWRSTVSELAPCLVDADPDMELADRIAADLQAIGSGQLDGASTTMRRHVSAVDRALLPRVRAAAAALRASRERFVACNLRLVVKTAMSYDHGSLPLSDLIQEGNLGLMKAVDRFDQRRGCRFSTYATWWIRHAIGRAVANHSRTVRIPVNLRQTQYRVTRVAGRLEAELGRGVGNDELAAEMAESESRIARARRAMAPTLSLDSPIGNDGHAMVLGDVLSDETAHRFAEAVDTDNSASRMRAALASLSPLETRILTRRYGLDDGTEATLHEIGLEHSLSRERIRQLQNGALAKLRRKLKTCP